MVISLELTELAGPEFVPSVTELAKSCMTTVPSLEQITPNVALVPRLCETEVVVQEFDPETCTKSEVEMSETDSEKLTVKLKPLLLDSGLGETTEAVGID